MPKKKVAKKAKKKKSATKSKSKKAKKAVKKKAIKKKATKKSSKSKKSSSSGAFSGLNMDALGSAIQKKIKKAHSGSPSKSSSSSKKEKSVGDRIPTGVPGFDKLIEGGFRKETVNLIAGGAGCGKSIFCMQYLIHGIETQDEPGVYISFEESPDEIYEDMERFGWDLQGYVKDKKLIILNYTPEQVGKVLKSGGGTIRDAIESIKARRIVIDSLTAFTLLYDNELEKRKASLALGDAIKKWKCTALLISEEEHNIQESAVGFMEFEVDGVIFVYNSRKEFGRQRSIEVMKMRATNHAQKIFPLKISDEGITVYPDEAMF